MVPKIPRIKKKNRKIGDKARNVVNNIITIIEALWCPLYFLQAIETQCEIKNNYILIDLGSKQLMNIFLHNGRYKMMNFLN